jgi:hypothetical protein
MGIFDKPSTAAPAATPRERSVSTVDPTRIAPTGQPPRPSGTTTGPAVTTETRPTAPPKGGDR